MKATDYAGIKALTAKQEEMLLFPHFSNKDAWKLGNFLTEKVYEKGIELAICIRRMNGCILYQHLTEKTNTNNVNWMGRKFRTVSLMEMSSLQAWATCHINGESIVDMGLLDTEYVLVGGGFPVHLTTGELVGVITVSNLPHEQDHQFIVECLQEYLGVKDVPVMAFDPE